MKNTREKNSLNCTLGRGYIFACVLLPELLMVSEEIEEKLLRKSFRKFFITFQIFLVPLGINCSSLNIPSTIPLGMRLKLKDRGGDRSQGCRADTVWKFNHNYNLLPLCSSPLCHCTSNE